MSKRPDIFIILIALFSPSVTSAQEKPGTVQGGNQGEPGRSPAAQKPDTNSPAVNPGRPTISDPASLTAPGWLEVEFGGQKNLDRDRLVYCAL